MEFTLLWATLTAVLFAWVGTRIWSDGLPDRATDRIVAAMAIGLGVGRLTAMVLQGTNPLLNPADILIVRGGVHTGAATVGAITSYIWTAGWRLDHLDAITPAALAGLAGWHAGCVWRSACLGTASDLGWAWAQDGSVVTRHPVEVYTALALLVGSWVVSRLPTTVLTKAGAGLAIAGAVRLATQPLRLSITGGPVGWYIAAVIVGLSAMWLGPRVRLGAATST